MTTAGVDETARGVEKAAAGQKIEGSMRDKLADLVRAVYGKPGVLAMTMTPPAGGSRAWRRQGAGAFTLHHL